MADWLVRDEDNEAAQEDVVLGLLLSMVIGLLFVSRIALAIASGGLVVSALGLP